MSIHSVIDERRAELADLCQRHHVRRLDVFGSAATGAFDPQTSDLDFLVEFEVTEPSAYGNAFFGLLNDLRTMFRRRVDLLTRRSLRNPYLIREIEETQQPVYVASS